MDLQPILQRAIEFLPPLILSLTFHECAHAWSARRLGDDTAERMGRLTLNPLPHIDLFGTILLPLLSAPIGWAKPVPVNPARFRRGIRTATGVMLTSAAGPLANLLLALICAGVLGVFLRLGPEATRTNEAIVAFLQVMVHLNVGLMLFNLLPVPPLDGGGVAAAFIPARLQGAWDTFSRFSPLLLLALLLLPGRPLGYVIFGPARLIVRTLYRVALPT